MTTFQFGDQQNTQTPFGGFPFGSTTSTSAPSLGTGIGANPLGASTPFGAFGATTTTSAVFGTTQTAPAFSSSLFPTSTATTSAFGSLGAATAAAPGFNFGAPGTSCFGTGSTFTTATTSAAPATIGLGGVDIQTSTSLNGGNPSNKKDSKAVKESQIPNELAVTVESFKKYVKEQKAIREEMSRVSSKNIFRVQEQVNTLKQQLSVVSNGLQRNAVAIAKLKEESNCELKNAEIAQRTKDAPASVQYENNAPTEYFEFLANSFEKQMQSYRQQIEQLERHLVSLTQPYTLTTNEWTAIGRRLHDTFVTLAAQLQTVHQEVQLYKEHFINEQKLNHADVRSLLGQRKDYLKDAISNSYLPAAVTYGPSPFAAVQSAVGKAISNVFHRSQQLPGLAGGNLSSSFNLNRSTSFQTSTPFKPLGK